MTARTVPRRPRPRVLVIALVAVALAAGAVWYWLQSGQSVSTENAYVNARVVQVSSLVMGQVVEVAVRENVLVHKSDILFALDRRPFEAALAEAEGKLRQAEQGTRADTSEVSASQADVARLNVDLANAETSLRRSQQLVQQGFLSKQALDDAQARVNSARAAVEAGVARVAKARAAISTTQGVTPAVRVAQAEVEKARLDLEHAVVRAPEDGIVTRFDLTAGTVVTPGNPLFALVVDRSFWVDANFKETQLAKMRIGQPVELHSDLYDRDRHVPRSHVPWSRRKPGGWDGCRVLAAAATERQRQLGEGGATRAGEGDGGRP